MSISVGATRRRNDRAWSISGIACVTLECEEQRGTGGGKRVRRSPRPGMAGLVSLVQESRLHCGQGGATEVLQGD